MWHTCCASHKEHTYTQLKSLNLSRAQARSGRERDNLMSKVQLMCPLSMYGGEVAREHSRFQRSVCCSCSMGSVSEVRLCGYTALCSLLAARKRPSQISTLRTRSTCAAAAAATWLGKLSTAVRCACAVHWTRRDTFVCVVVSLQRSEFYLPFKLWKIIWFVLYLQTLSWIYVL